MQLSKRLASAADAVRIASRTGGYPSATDGIVDGGLSLFAAR